MWPGESQPVIPPMSRPDNVALATMSNPSFHRRFVRPLVHAASIGVDKVAAPRPGVTFLIYHRVGATTPSPVDLKTPSFRSQMAVLAGRNSVISIDEAVKLLASQGRADDGHKVVITFDDGTRDWSEVVLPILAEFQLPAVFYVATAFVDEQRPFPRDGRPISWAGVRELVDSGLGTIGSHTHTHPMLDRVTVADAERELDQSVGLIQDRLGVAAGHFAYPRAVRGSPAVEAVVRDRFKSAVVAGGRANPWSSSDLHRLMRTPVHGDDPLAVVARKAAGGLRLEGRLREGLDAVRYRANRDR